MDDTSITSVYEYENETWSRCANSYLDTFSGLTNQMLGKLVDITDVAVGAKVLDLGCGPGNSSRAFKEAGAEVTGIDFSGQMLQVARAANSDITYKQANLEALPEPDGSCDIVVANYVVHHLPDPAQVFSEVARVLKPGGRFAFAVWGAPQQQSSIGCFIQAVSEHHEMAELPHGPLYGVTDKMVFSPMLESVGLRKFELSNHDLIWACETLAPVIEGLWTWANCDAYDQDKQEKIRAQMIRNCAAFVTDAGYAFPHTAILGCAVKE